MPPYSIEHLPAENTFICRWEPDFSFSEHLKDFDNLAKQQLDGQTVPHYMIMIFGGLKLTFNDIITGASHATRGERPIFRHPKVKEVILVTTDSAIQFTARGMKSASFGNVDIRVFDTLDEALAYVREAAA